MDIDVFGKRLKIVRDHLHLSQQELGEKLHVTQNIISRIERGDGASITVFLHLLEYLSEYIHIEFLFAKESEFKIVEKFGGKMDVSKLIQEDFDHFNDAITDAIGVMGNMKKNMLLYESKIHKATV